MRNLCAVLVCLSLLGCRHESQPPVQRETAGPGESAGDHGAADTVALVPPDSAPFFLVSGGVLTERGAVVAEWSSGQVRFFNADGSLAVVRGGRGEGPGEFQSLTWIQRHGDWLALGDTRLSRVTFFSGNGELNRVVQLSSMPHGGRVNPIGVFESGEILAGVVSQKPRVPSGPGPAAQVVSDTFELALFDSSGQFKRRVGSYVGNEYVVANAQRNGASGISIGPAIFGRAGGIAVRRQTFLVLDPLRAVVIRYASTGEVLDTVGAEGPGVAMRPEDAKLVRARLVEEVPESERPGELFDRSPIPDRLPRYGWASLAPSRVLTVSDSGDVWLLRFGGVRDPTRRWDHFDRLNKVTVVEGPRGGTLLDVHAGRALFRIAHPDGTEDVVMVPVG